MNFGMMTAPASANPSDASIDYIMRDAMACANAGITGIGNIAKAGVGLYNAMGNMFSNPMGMMGQQNTNPYSANMGVVPQAHYAYAEGVPGYVNTAYLNPMTSQMPMGYPGFADSDYGVCVGYNGFGGRP